MLVTCIAPGLASRLRYYVSPTCTLIPYTPQYNTRLATTVNMYVPLTQIEHALKRAPLQERKPKKRSQQDGQSEEEQTAAAGAEEGEAPNATMPSTAAAKSSLEQQQQQQQRPSKRHKPGDQQQQQPAAEAAAADRHKWVRTVALGV